MSQDRGFTEHPVFVETPVGAVGAIVTAPNDPPTAAAVLLVGLGATRAGTNCLWARLTRSLAELGVVSVRADYPGLAESQSVPMEATPEAIDQTVKWFRERTPDLRLLVVGHCLGGLLARDILLREPDFLGVAAISPPLGADRHFAKSSTSMSLSRRAHVALYKSKKALLRGATRARYGRAPHGEAHLKQVLDPDVRSAVVVPEVVQALAATGRTWFLTGQGDFATEPLRSLEAEIAATGSALEVLPFGIYPSATPETQDAILDRTVAWARVCLRDVEVRT